MTDKNTEFTEISVAELQRTHGPVKECVWCGSANVCMNHAPHMAHAFMACMSCYATGPAGANVAAALDRWNYPVVDRGYIANPAMCTTDEAQP
jgi:hypothetical protein